MSKKITSRDLSNYQPLNTLNSESLREICGKLVIVEINKGDNIFIQGDAKADHIFLHEGVVDLVENSKVVKTLKAGTEDTKTALAHIIPRNFTAIAQSKVIAFMIDSDLLDMMLTWDQTGTFQVDELNSE
ncbi:MAG: cyclic nucleotide-binding domain-containing protein, partial [Gammaproteobacteria bacterium]|nr:cyclic nucleotide-binding domain-containing protein [Gammaproteobacteria bacterium]